MLTLLSVWLATGCNPVPAAWQRPAGALGILFGILAIVFSAKFPTAKGPPSRPLNILVGSAFIVIGGLVVLGVIHLAEHC